MSMPRECPAVPGSQCGPPETRERWPLTSALWTDTPRGGRGRQPCGWGLRGVGVGSPGASGRRLPQADRSQEGATAPGCRSGCGWGGAPGAICSGALLATCLGQGLPLPALQGPPCHGAVLTG